MKKLLTIILSILMVLASFPATVFAENKWETIDSSGCSGNDGSKSGEYFKVDYDHADEDGWLVAYYKNDELIVSQANDKDKKIEKIIFEVSYVNGDWSSSDIVATGGNIETISNIKEGDYITISFSTPVESATISEIYKELNRDIQFSSAKIYYELDPNEEYGLTVKVNDSNMGTAYAAVDGTPVTSAKKGTPISLIAQYKPGYRFRQWTSNIAGLDLRSNEFEMIDEDITVTAIFSEISDVFDIIFYTNGFPLAPESGDIPWENDKGAKVHFEIPENGALLFNYSSESFNLDCVNSVTKNGDLYECTVSGVTYKFHLTNDQCDYFTVSGHSVDGFNGEYRAPVTIADILPTDFPTSYDGSRWLASEDAKAYLNGNNLTFTYKGYEDSWKVNDCPISTDYVVTKNGNDYVFKMTEEDLSEDVFTFNMENGKLVSITASGNMLSKLRLNGTYKPSKTIADILPSDFPFFDTEVPSNVWLNENGKKMYVTIDSGQKSLIYGSYSNRVANIISQSDSNYTFAPGNGDILTFKMNNGVLEEVIVEGSDATRDGNAGTYKPQGTKYAITNLTPEGDRNTNNGYITVVSEAAEGSSVGITVAANEHYELDTLKYNDGTNHTIVKDSNDKYIFKMPSKDISVSATFKASSYDVTFHSDEEGWTDETIAETYGDKYVLPDTTPSKVGYKFDGWYTSSTSGTKVTEDTTVDLSQKQTLYAHWVPNKYMVTFDANYKGASYSKQIEQTYDDKYLLPSEAERPTRTNYTFAGWFDASTGGNEITSSTKVQITEAKTLYAHWTAGTYTINYKDEGGSAFSGIHEEGYPTIHTFGFNTTLKGATKNNCIFDGWYTDINCTEGNKVTVLGAEDYIEDITLYAKFIKAEAAIVNFLDGSKKLYASLLDALANAGSMDDVVLLRDIIFTNNEDIVVGDSVFLDLNNHVLKTTGVVTNKGIINLYNENADIIDYLLYNVPGTYGAGEELKLPNVSNPDYIVPDGTFLIADVETSPNSQMFKFAIFDDDTLEWSADVKKGTQLFVKDSLTLGGDIIAPTDDNDADTLVKVTKLTLNDDIVIGSNIKDDGLATLFVESYDSSSDGSHNRGSINPNGKTITLNRTGVLVVSSDVNFNENIIIPGVDGMIVDKTYDETNKTYIYTLKLDHHYTNDPFTIPNNYTGTIEFVTDADCSIVGDVTVKVDGKVLDDSKYDLSFASVHVILHNDYLRTLSVGKHTMTIDVKGYKTINQDFYITGNTPYPKYIIPKTGIE